MKAIASSESLLVTGSTDECIRYLYTPLFFFCICLRLFPSPSLGTLHVLLLRLLLLLFVFVFASDFFHLSAFREAWENRSFSSSRERKRALLFRKTAVEYRRCMYSAEHHC